VRSPKRSTAQVLCEARAIIGESPVDCGDKIVWTDPVSRELLVLDASGRLQKIATESPIWSLRRLPTGDLVGTQDANFVRLDALRVCEFGVSAPLPAGVRLNDMAVDAAGGLWAGAMHRGLLATRGALVHAASINSAVTTCGSGLGVPNGMAFTALGSSLCVVDTLSRTLLAYPRLAEGLAEPIVLSDFMNVPGKPDGMTLAPDGTFWVAMWGGGCVAQLASDGALLRTVAVPAPHVSSACVDASGRLLVTTSRMRLSPQALEEFPLSGSLFCVELDRDT
jgi:xylono-1,5-lactonase